MNLKTLMNFNNNDYYFSLLIKFYLLFLFISFNFNFILILFYSILDFFFRCKSKQSCTIKVSSNLFTEDPCPGTHKYLEVQYRCIAKSIMNQSLHYVLGI